MEGRKLRKGEGGKGVRGSYVHRDDCTMGHRKFRGKEGSDSVVSLTVRGEQIQGLEGIDNRKVTYVCGRI